MFNCQVCKSNFLASVSSVPTTSRYNHPKRLANPKKIPLVLRCGHTFCEGCINKLKEKIPKSQTKSDSSPQFDVELDFDYKFKLPCPQSGCGVITLLRGSMRELPENIYILSHLESSREADLKKSLDEIMAGASGVSQVVDKTKNRPSRSRSSKSLSKEDKNCKIHARDIEYFCEDDNCLICSKCYIMGDHKGHNIQSIEDKNKLILGDVESGINTLKTVLSQLNRLAKKSSFVNSDLKSELVSLIRCINHSFMNVHSALQAREAEMIECVLSAFKRYLLSFENEKRESLNAKADLKILFQEATDLLENAGIIVDGNSVVERMKQASQIPCVVPKQSEISMRGNFEWQETKLAELMAIIQSFGAISGSLNKLSLKTVDEVGDDLESDDQGSLRSESVASYPASDIQSFTSQNSVDVIIESDSDNGSEKSSSSKSKRNLSQKTIPEFKENIVIPTLKGAPHQVIVTHIHSPCDFFVQLSANKTKFQTLADNMNSWCRRQSSAKHIPQSVERGNFVLARFGMDKLWYRAQVQDICKTDDEDGDQNLKVKVKYIDFGNVEVVGWNNLRVMQGRFLKYPEFSVRCCLHDIAPFDKDCWEYKDSEMLLRMTNEKILLMNVVSVTGNIFFVDLICTPAENVSGDGFASIRDMLVFMEHAQFCTDETESATKLTVPTLKTRSFFKPSALKNGETVAVKVTETISPSDLYIIPMADEFNFYVHLQEEMQQTYKKDTGNIYLVHWPREGMLCAVELKKGKWCRGQVVQIKTHQKVTVFLTDIGRTLDVPCDKMRKLLTDFMKLPSQAIRCSLKDVLPLDDETCWSKAAKQWLDTKVRGSKGTARIVRWGDPTEIILWREEDGYSNSQTVNCQMVKRGLAQGCGLMPVGQPQGRNKPEASSPKKYQLSPKQPVSPSQVKLPHSPSDKRLSPSKKSPSPRLSSSSSSSPSPGKKSPKHLNACRQLSTTDFAMCEKESPSKPKTSSGKKESKVVSPKPQFTNATEVAAPDDSHIDVVICEYDSPGQFYIQMRENEDILRDLMEDMQETYKDTEPLEKVDWIVDDFCAVRSTDDDRWYRGKILNINSLSDIEVEFLDHGIVQKVSSDRLRILKHELGLRLHCAAVRCYLTNLISAGSSDPETWTRTAVEFMADKIRDRKLFIKTEGDPTDLGLPVDVIVEDEVPPSAFEPAKHAYHSLRSLLQDSGLAMESKSKRSNSLTGASVKDALEKKIFQKDPHKSEKAEGAAAAAAALVCQEEESKDSGNVSTSSQTFNEMRSASSADGNIDSSINEDQDETAVESTVDSAKQFEEIPSFDIPPYQNPPVGESFEVMPTYVNYSSVIFAQPVKWEAAILSMAETLEKTYQGSEARCVSWKPEQSCVAKFEDEQWYRGIIQAVDNDQAMVFFPDFGNSSSVTFSNLRPITKEIASQHVLAYSCLVDDLFPNTDDGFWPASTIDDIHAMLVNCPCTFEVTDMHVESIFKVKVLKSEPEGWNLSSILVQKGVAITFTDLRVHYELSRKINTFLGRNSFFQHKPGDVGDRFKAIVTQVELPNVVYIQKLRQSDEDSFDFVELADIAELNKKIDEFDEMMEAVNLDTSPTCVELPSEGLICLGQFGFDRRWYRALCIEQYQEDDACLMLYIDYGNVEVVQRDRLRLLPAEYMGIPPQSFRCYLNLSPPPSADSLWNSFSLQAMMQALANKEMVVTVTQTVPLTVELRVDAEDGLAHLAYEDVIDKGLVLKPEQPTSPTLAINGYCNGHVGVDAAGVEIEEEKSDDDEGDSDTA